MKVNGFFETISNITNMTAIASIPAAVGGELLIAMHTDQPAQCFLISLDGGGMGRPPRTAAFIAAEFPFTPCARLCYRHPAIWARGASQHFNVPVQPMTATVVAHPITAQADR